MFKEPLLKRRFGDGSPDAYPCQLRGKPGHFLVDGVEGRVAFISLEAEQPERVWPIDDILELKKDQVSVARMTVGMFGGAAVDSLGLGIRMALPGDHESMEKETEKTAAFIKKKGDLFHFERVRRRDKLFNRLLALGSQRWELL